MVKRLNKNDKYCYARHMEIDLLITDMAAILNLLDSRSVKGCPGDMSTIRYTRSVHIHALFGPIFH